MKKFLSVILSILMVVTMLPMTVLPASAAATNKNLTLGIRLYMDEGLCSHNEQQPVDTIYVSTSLGYKEEYRLTYEYSDNDLVIEYYYGVSHAGHSADGVRTSFTVPDFSCEKTYNQKFTTANGSIVTFKRSAGHAVSSWTNNNNGTHSGTCSFCGAVTVNCTYSEATCVAPKTCLACGATKGDIDATAHSWANLDGICANGCGATCAHENQTGSVCEICGADIHLCSYTNGFCTECDAYEPATLVTNENYESFYLKADYVGYYAISNAGHLFWYANYINTVDRTANAVITEDIDLENRPWTPIGSTGENSNNFRGIFDGQNYIIRGLYVEGDRAGLGFFGEVRTGTVKNFTIYGEVVVNTEVDYVGGVIGSICGVNGENDLERNGAIIQNIKSFVNLTVKAHGVGKIGGFVGYANHQSLIEKCSWYGTFDAGEYRVDNGAGGFIGRIQENSSEVTIRNCGAYGTIKTNYAGDYNNTATIYMGGFLSFSNTNAKTTIENCLFAGRFKRGENLTDEAFLGAFGTLRSVNAIKNCYYLGDDGLEAVHSDSNLKPGSDNVEITKATGEELKKGTVAKKLGEYWEQGVHYPTLKDHAAHWGSETYGYTDNGDGTHDMVCTGCGHVEVYNEAHSGGTATCTEQAKCERCGASYGELDPDNHASDTYTYADNGDGTHKATYSCCGAAVAEVPHTLDITTGKCSACGTDMTAIATVTDGTNTYYAADAATLNQAVTAILETGSRTFTVELPADTEAEMITAIRRAICDTEGVADGSINLTLGGVTSIPGTTNWDGVAFGPGDIYDEAGKIVDQELVTQLASINLPDATEIGAQAFYFCENLVAVSAPKAQTIGAQALGYTALTSVEFPELTTIPTDMFSGTWTLSSAKFPKVTTVEQGGLLIGAKFNPENNPTPFPLELTAEGDITFIGSYHFNIAERNYSGKVDLVLCCDKKDAVIFHDDGTATWQVRDDLSYTFKSITFKHSYTDGKCDCGYECPHENETGDTCSVCGATIRFATITGVSINVDGVVYTSDNTSAENPAVINPDSVVTVTVTGENFDLLPADPENAVIGFTYFGQNLEWLYNNPSKFDIDTVNNTVSFPANYNVLSQATTASELTYTNDDWYTDIGSGVYVIYIDKKDIADTLITLDNTEFIYSGNPIEPTVLVMADGQALMEGEHYTLTFESNVNAGTASVTVKGIGDYTGEVTKDFTITKAYYDLTAPTPNTLTYKGEDQYLVSAGTVEGADFEYSLDGASWSTSIPQAKDVGNYTVYYRVLADENHYGIEGTVDVTIKECPHEWNEGVLTRPVYDAVLGSKDGYYTYTCTLCGEEKTETVKSADYSAYEAVSEEINALLQSDDLTSEAKQAIYSAANECGHLSNDLTESEQNKVDSLVAELEKIVADADEKIASGEYVKADYTEIDEVIKAIDEALENATISEEMANELSDIKSQLEALKENENTSMADAAELLERVKAVAETMADCANGIHSFTKYEVTEEAECGKAGKEVATCDHGCGATDEKEIPALTHEPLEAVKENEVAPKCGVAGSYDLVVYCDLCGDELDRDTVTVDALTHTDEDGDYLCDHGCGHEFPKPVEPEQPDTPDTPDEPDTPDIPDEPTDEACDHLCHKDGLLGFFWKIACFFFRLFNIQQYCDCGEIHYDAPVFG